MSTETLLRRWTELLLSCLCGNRVCVWHVFSHTHFISEHWFPTEPHMSEMCLCVWTLHKAALRLSLDNLLSCQLLYMTHFLSSFHLLNPCYRPLQDVHATTCHESWLFALCNGYWSTFISNIFFLIVHTKMKDLSSFTHPPAVSGVSDILVFKKREFVRISHLVKYVRIAVRSDWFNRS